jgi:hypothetical protein
MIPKIKAVVPLENFQLHVSFDDGRNVIYDVNEDINTLQNYNLLKEIDYLFQQVKLDPSSTCIFWNDEIDLPSDTIYEYGKIL